MPLLLYVNFEEGHPSSSPYVLGPTEYSAGSDEAILGFAFGGSISATGATVGSYGVQFAGFDSHLKIAVSSGDIFSKTAGRCGVWVKHGGTDDTGIFVADGSALSLETRSSGAVRLRWAGSLILNSGDWGETIPTDRTPRFVEVKWDRANNLRAIRISTDSAEGTWREDTGSWSEPADATHVRLTGAYGNVYADNWLISDDPDEDLWALRNLTDYADYGTTDALLVGVSETPAVDASLATTETLSVGLSEVASVVVTTTASETLAAGLVEAAAIGATATATDEWGLTLAETPAVEAGEGVISASEALAVALEEAAALVVEVHATEAFTVGLDAAVGLASSLAATDTVAVSLDQVAGLTASLATTDTWTAGLTEAGAVTWELLASEDWTVACDLAGLVEETEVITPPLSGRRGVDMRTQGGRRGADGATAIRRSRRATDGAWRRRG